MAQSSGSVSVSSACIVLSNVRGPSGAASAARRARDSRINSVVGGLHVLGAYLVEGNTEFYLKQGIGSAGTRHYFQGNRRFERGTGAA